MHANTISPQRASGWPTTAVSRISGQSVKLGNHNGDDGCHEAFRPSCCESKALVAAIAAGYVRNHKPDRERWWIAELDRQRTGMQVGSGVLRHRIGLPVAHFILKSFRATGPHGTSASSYQKNSCCRYDRGLQRRLVRLVGVCADAAVTDACDPV